MKQTTFAPVDTTPERVCGLGHIVLYVADLDRSLTFYRDIVGWPVIQPPGQHRFAGFCAGDTHHDLLLIEVGPNAARIPRGRRLGMYHFGVKVGDSDDDLRTVLARLRAHPDLATVLDMVGEGFAHNIQRAGPRRQRVELYVDLPGRRLEPRGRLQHRAPPPTAAVKPPPEVVVNLPGSSM